MNYYRYYDRVLRTTTGIRTLREADINQVGSLPLTDLEIHIDNTFEYFPSQTADILNCNDYWSVSICGDPIYHIYKNSKLIRAFSRDLTYIEDSIINIPASVLCFTCNKILLHCSSILINNHAYAFIGNKGLGKTTFSLLLSEHYRLLGDDTLMISGLNDDGEIEVVPSQTASKISPQAMEEFKDRISMVSDFTLNSQKHLCMIENSVIDKDASRYHLKGLVLLYRNKSDRLNANMIRVQSTRRILVSKNIIGIQYFPYEYRYAINNNSLLIALSNLKTFTLSIPEGINNLRRMRDEYIRFFNSIGDMQ